MENATKATISITKGTRMTAKFYKETIKQQQHHINMLMNKIAVVRDVWKSDQRLLDEIVELKAEVERLKKVITDYTPSTPLL